MGIHPIDKAAVHRICSGQVILDLATAVKELVENSLDAGATSIEVRLKGHGSELIEVADNGGGVPPTDYESLMLKYHTSKLSTFEDLQDLASFGFRGEALSSLCAVATVSVVTRTAEEECGSKLTYDHSGKLMSRTAAPRAVGTTVAVQNLFAPLPVRHKEFMRGVKREYARLVSLLQSYALIATGVRLVCTHQAGSSSRTVVVSTQAAPSLRDNVTAVFGGRAVEGLEEVSIEGDEGLHIVGLVSKATAGTGRAAGDRQFFFVNGRPVDLPKASKVINEVFKSLSSSAVAASRPMAVLDFHLPRDAYDINVTPDKRKVFLHREAAILTALQQGLMELWEPSRARYTVNDLTQGGRSGKKRRSGEAPAPFAAFAVGGAGPSGKEKHLHDNEEEAEEESEREEEVSASQDEEASAEGSEIIEDEPPGQATVREEVQGSRKSAPHAVERGHEAPPPKRQAVAALPLAAFAMGGPVKEAKGPSNGPPVATGLGSADGGGRCAASEPTVRQSSLLAFGFEKETVRSSSREQARALRSRNGKETLSGKAALGNGKDTSDGEADSEDDMSEDDLQPEVIQTGASTPEEVQVEIISQGGAEEEPETRVEGTEEAVAAATAGPAQGAIQQRAAVENGMRQAEPAGGEAEIEVFELLDAQALADEAIGQEGVYGEDGAEDDIMEDEDFGAMMASGLEMAIDLDGIRAAAVASARSAAERTQRSTQRPATRFAAASLAPAAGTGARTGDEADEAVAEHELERTFKKADFQRMKVLGQFNLGFIIARLGRDLFIVDQHASGETSCCCWCCHKTLHKMH